ncbi:MAG: polysaccharide deacetylase family protein [Planctomycetota bacterium]|nr:polysaccharide deacetylase family protein [Planctomycetota bacterium]
MQSKFAMNNLSLLSAFFWLPTHQSPWQVLVMILLAAYANQNLYAADPIPEKLVVLTFDDSAKSHFTVVRPLLLNYGFSATFFITEGFDFKENKRDYMTWDEIAQLHQDGFEIGNHTRDHLGINDKNLDKLTEQLEGINQRCDEYKIPKPVSFAWPGNALAPAGLKALGEAGIRFARRGGAPEYEYEKGRGFAYEPMLDHPLLIPSAGDARPDWGLDDFKRAIEQARYGRIAVLQFHGVPDTAHSWVNTPKANFEQYMRYLAVEGYKVIALRDLEKYVDTAIKPQDPWGAIEDRKATIANQSDYQNFRQPKNDGELEFWLRNMLVDHHYTLTEASAATGLTAQQIKLDSERLKIDGPTKLPPNRLRVLPYPGGRHPRIGFRDGAIRPQRDTKLSVFLPWDSQSYVVADVPEAIWWMQQDRRELMYLAHTHVKTTWDNQRKTLQPVEWQHTDSGWKFVRQLPNRVEFGCTVEPRERDLLLNLWIKNGSDEPLSGLVIQNCMMLARAAGFDQLANDNKLIEKPFVACHDGTKSRWIITGWQNCVRPWANQPCPCMHSDPQFPDCPPGESRQLNGVLSFYAGTDIQSELKRLEVVIAQRPIDR